MIIVHRCFHRGKGLGFAATMARAWGGRKVDRFRCVPRILRSNHCDFGRTVWRRRWTYMLDSIETPGCGHPSSKRTESCCNQDKPRQVSDRHARAKLAHVHISLAFPHDSELGAFAVCIVKRAVFAHGAFHVFRWRRNGVAYPAPTRAPCANCAASWQWFNLPNLAEDEAVLAPDVPRVAAVFAGFGDAFETGDEEKFAGMVPN